MEKENFKIIIDRWKLGIKIKRLTLTELQKIISSKVSDTQKSFLFGEEKISKIFQLD